MELNNSIGITSPGDIGLMGLYFAHHFEVPLVASWHHNLHELAARRAVRVAGGAHVRVERRRVFRNDIRARVLDGLRPDHAGMASRLLTRAPEEAARL